MRADVPVVRLAAALAAVGLSVKATADGLIVSPPDVSHVPGLTPTIGAVRSSVEMGAAK